jgi:Ca-activated chloride channel homolog
MIGLWRIYILRTGILLFILSMPITAQEAKKRPPTFREHVDMVFLKVSVSDSLNRLVTGLNKENFLIYEDNIRQAISHFSNESAPVSMGIIFDISASMRDNQNTARNMFRQLMKFGNPNPEDEYFLITFNKKINLSQNFTENREKLEYEIFFQKPGGWTALFDAVYRGVDKMKESKNDKKALVLISDGEENSSRYSRKELFEFIKESDIPIYSGGCRNGLLEYISKITGGRFLNAGDLAYQLKLLHSELRSQYVLGYISSNTTRDGKFRKIKVALNLPTDLGKFKISSKKGYFAPKY